MVASRNYECRQRYYVCSSKRKPATVVASMGMPPRARLSRLELQILGAFWEHGPSTVRDVLERTRARRRPAYTTVQTVIRRLEAKKAVRCTRRIGNANVYEAVLAREDACRTLLGDLLALFGGSSLPLIAHLVESGQVDRDDLEAAAELLEKRP
jgi:BlaI family penicillinase repressor